VFRWDAAANLVSGDHPGGYVEYNRLRMFEDKRFEYDRFGRLSRKLSGRGPTKEQTFEYDDWHQLKTAVTKDRIGIATTHFEYDALGRRVRKLNGGYASTDFLWDGMRLIQETYHDRRGEEALTYLYEDGSYVPLARMDHHAPAANDSGVADAVYYFHNDVSGMPEELSDSGGDLVWQARYKVWGNTVQEEWIQRAPVRAAVAWSEAQEAGAAPGHVPRPQNLRFQGQYLDRETGLHYNTFRFYDPDVGRFINQDPIGLQGGVNLYQYAANPLVWIDPWGWAADRLPRSNGYWDGEQGNSNWYSDNPSVNAVTGGDPVPFQGGRPDFSAWSKGELTFPEGTLDGTRQDFTKVYEQIGGAKDISPSAAQKLLRENGLTPHHLSQTQIQLIPSELHGNVPHTGSAADMRKTRC
jgi:RHS repeat-associated protein